ncbi:MAG: DUF3293 domain-containing protein [Flavobacteriaceae bacterium]|nr:DUF3293 domain-containing protein [Flavobacteriaceae bacterium]
MEKGCKIAQLTEASLGRVLQHIQGKKNVKSWGVVTAYRYGNTPSENRQANERLASELRAKGLGFFKLEGHWQECQDKSVNYFDCPKDKLKDSIEISLFVPNISIKDIHALGNQFEQDSVLYGGEDTKGNGVLVYKNGRVENVGEMHPDNMQQAYSKLRNTKKVFAFQRKKGDRKTLPNLPGSSAEKDDKLIKLLPKDILNKTVKNPETGRNIKVQSALRYQDDAPVKKNAMSLVQMMQKKN